MLSFNPGTDLNEMFIEFLIRASISKSRIILIVRSEIVEGSCKLRIVVCNMLLYLSSRSVFSIHNVQRFGHYLEGLSLSVVTE